MRLRLAEWVALLSVIKADHVRHMAHPAAEEGRHAVESATRHQWPTERGDRPRGFLVGSSARGYSRIMEWRDLITIEPGKRGGHACVRHMRITVADVLGWLSIGLSPSEIVSDYPELTEADIRACLAYAADRERGTVTT